MRTALCPGSFDPLHNGHIDIFETASRLYDRVVVATIRNPGKGEPLFTLDERKELINEALGHLDNIEVVSMTKLTVDVARDVGADVIVKGLRDGTDFASEMQQAQMNKAISGIQTVFLPCGPESSFIAATLIRQIAMFGGADRLGSMVPENVAKRLNEKYARR
ncbi:MAG TPA: pantetheine-phosphate adenylyltransferase [Acidimicrobiales bacterium]|nr:pantetheine-phosphate adenylyltransferase [Acidimicrobiales bacterium]